MSLMQIIAGEGYPEPKVSLDRGTITRAARALGVTREHLSRVLNGHRPSRSLLRRFTKFLANSQK